VTIGDVIAKSRKESAAGLNEDEEKEIWDTLQVVSILSKFLSLLRSVCKESKDWKGNGIFIVAKRCRTMFIFHSFSRIGFPNRDWRKSSLSFLRCLPRELDQEWIS
jgi:hypothetical protein